MAISFIIVENAELDQYIARSLVRRVLGDVPVAAFHSGDAALDHITANGLHTGRAVILLDLMMPRSDGFQFIRQFEELSEKVQNSYRIVVTTSSLNKTALERLRARETVEMVIEKPLTKDKMRALLSKLGFEEMSGSGK